MAPQSLVDVWPFLEFVSTRALACQNEFGFGEMRHLLKIQPTLSYFFAIEACGHKDFSNLMYVHWLTLREQCSRRPRNKMTLSRFRNSGQSSPPQVRPGHHPNNQC